MSQLSRERRVPASPLRLTSQKMSLSDVLIFMTEPSLRGSSYKMFSLSLSSSLSLTHSLPFSLSRLSSSKLLVEQQMLAGAQHKKKKKTNKRRRPCLISFTPIFCTVISYEEEKNCVIHILGDINLTSRSPRLAVLLFAFVKFYFDLLELNILFYLQLFKMNLFEGPHFTRFAFPTSSFSGVSLQLAMSHFFQGCICCAHRRPAQNADGAGAEQKGGPFPFGLLRALKMNKAKVNVIVIIGAGSYIGRFPHCAGEPL